LRHVALDSPHPHWRIIPLPCSIHDKTLTLAGTVKEFEWVNPAFLDAHHHTGRGHRQIPDYSFEMGSPGQLGS
jgi:hypothetical protein